MSLLLRPQLALGEGPHGYLFRLAETNGLALAVLADLGVHFNVQLLGRLGFLPTSNAGDAVAAYAKAIEQSLVMHPQSWNRAVPRFCPDCLREKGFWQFGWEMLFFDACPVHGTWLIDRCPVCNQDLSWQRPELLRCACGVALASIRAVPCPDSVARLSHALAYSVLPEETETPFSIAQRMRLTQLQRLIRLLGAYADPLAIAKPQKILGSGRLDVSWHLTSLAAEILDGWPQSFFSMLGQMEASPSTFGAGRLRGRFGHFYSLLYRGLPEPEFDFLRQAFEEFVAEHWRGSFGGRNRRLANRLPKKMSWIPAKHARQLLGVSQRRLEALVACGEVASEVRHGRTGRTFLVVRRADVEAMAEGAESPAVDLVTASTLLGLKKQRAAALIPLVMPAVRKFGEVGYTWAIPRTLIDQIVFKDAVLPVRLSALEGEVSLAHVIRYWPWSDQALARCIDAYVKGEIKPSARLPDAGGVAGLLFNSGELKTWHASQCKDTESFSVPDVAERLSIKQEVAYYLVRNGLIKAESATVGRKAMSRVSATSLLDFTNGYVFGRDLAAELAISPRATAERLAMLGIHAVSGPGVDGCRQLLYAKSKELDKAKRLLAKSTKKIRTRQRLTMQLLLGSGG